MIPAADEARGGAAVAPPSDAEAGPVPPARAASSAELPPVARRARSSPDLTPEPPRAPAAPHVAGAPLASTARQAPAPAPAEPRASTAGQGPGTEPLAGLPLEVQEQLFGVLRAALDASLLPLLEKQKALEARLDGLNQAAQRDAGGAIASAVTPSLAPVSLPFSLDVKPSDAAASDPPPSVKASLVPTSYGFVIAPEGPVRRPSIELALENVGPIDVPDFGRGRRSAGSVLVALLVAGMFAAVAATILSYT